MQLNAKAQFSAMVKEHQDKIKSPFNSHCYLEELVLFCQDIANSVLEGKKSDFGTPLITEINALANKTTNPISRCAVLLQHSVCNDDRYNLSLSSDYIIESIPSAIIDLANTLTRFKGESYGNHHSRLISDHTAVNLMLTELVDRANITKYDKPSKADHVRCCGYLDRAMVLKNYQDYHLMQEEVVSDMLLSLNQVVPLDVDVMNYSGVQSTVRYFYEGGQIPIVLGTFTWRDGVATVEFIWTYHDAYFKDITITANITEEEFKDYVGVHYWHFTTRSISGKL